MWLCNHDPQLALSARLTGNRKVTVCMTNFKKIYFYAMRDLDWALRQITHHVNGLRGVCEFIMYLCLYCTSLIVLHSVKYYSEQAVEQEVAQCVLFSMGDSDIHLRLVKARPVIQKSPAPSFRKAFSFVFPQTCVVQHKIWRTSLCTTGTESHR